MAQYLQYVRQLERNMVLLGRPRRGLVDRSNPFEMYNDEAFRSRYRFSKESLIYIIDMLDEDLRRMAHRYDVIPAYLQVLTALRFYAVGSFQKMHGDESHMSQSSVCRVLPNVSEALARRRRQFVKFPTTREEVARSQQQFYHYCGFLGIIGAIDGTHIPIRGPGGNRALFFINRKNRYSINVQVVCNHLGQITSIVARWAGSTHDSRIFNESSLKQELEARANGSEWLLGDSGYQCLPFLMTPIQHPVGRPQVRYNTAHKRGRCVVERTFGQWKRRFPCLNDLRLKVENVFVTIIACAVLWNISINRREEDVPGLVPEEMPHVRLPPGHYDAIAGRLRRAQIIEDHFTH